MISAILETLFQALRLVTLISLSLHLHDVFSSLGDIVSSFEARNLERASRSNAKTGLCRSSKNVGKTRVFRFWTLRNLEKTRVFLMLGARWPS